MAKLLDLVRDRIRVLHYSIRTEDAYVDWIRRQAEIGVGSFYPRGKMSRHHLYPLVINSLSEAWGTGSDRT